MSIWVDKMYLKNVPVPDLQFDENYLDCRRIREVQYNTKGFYFGDVKIFIIQRPYLTIVYVLGYTCA